jgi:TP901 family phage tail tape measure protein
MSSEIEKLVVKIAGESDQYTAVYNDAIAKAEEAVTKIEQLAADAEAQQQVAMAEAAAVIAAITEPMEVYAQGVAKLDSLLEGGHLTQLQYNKALALAAKQLPDVQREQRELDEEMALAKRITTSVTTAEEEYLQKFNQLVSLLAKGRITQETYNRAVMELRNILPSVKAEQEKLAAAEEYEMGLRRRGTEITRDLMTVQEKYNEDLNEVIHLYGQGAITVDTYNRAVNKLAKDNDFTAQSLKNVASQIKSVSDGAERVGRSLSMWVTAPLTAIGAGSLYAFANFDDAITKSTAIMSGVTDEVRANMENAALAISDAGSTAPSKVAESFYFLASAGFDAAGSIQVLDDVEKFATAGHFEMAKATEMLADATSALGLKSKDAIEQEQNLVRVSDVLTEAANESNASVEQFAKSLTSKSAAAMRLMGIEVEEGVAVLAAYADQGVKGEMAGEKFTIMLRELQNAAQENKEVWKDMNLQVFDSEGNFMKIGDIIAQFEKKLDGATDAQKNQIFAMLGFRTESKDAISSLIGLSDKINEYEDDLIHAGGTTEEVAKKQLKSFTEETKNLWNQIEIAGIEIGRILAPIVRDITEDVKEWLKWWKELTVGQKEFIIVVGAVAAAIGPALVAIGMMGNGVSTLINTSNTLITALRGVNTELNLLPLGIAGAAAALTFGLMYALDAVIEKASGVKKSLEELNALQDKLLDAREQGFKNELDSIIGLPPEQQQVAFKEALERANEEYASYVQKQKDLKKSLEADAKKWVGMTNDEIAAVKSNIKEAEKMAEQAQSHIKILGQQAKTMDRVRTARAGAAKAQDLTDFEHEAALVKESKKIIESALTPMQKFEKEKAKLDEMMNREKPLLTMEQYNQSLAKFQKELDKANKLPKEPKIPKPKKDTALSELEREHKRMVEKALTPQEKLAKEEEKIREMRKKGIIKSAEEETKLLENVRKEYKKDIEGKVKFSEQGVDALLRGTAEFESRFQDYLSLRPGQEDYKLPMDEQKDFEKEFAVAMGQEPPDVKELAADEDHEDNKKMIEILQAIAENTKSKVPGLGPILAPLNLAVGAAVGGK